MSESQASQNNPGADAPAGRYDWKDPNIPVGDSPPHAKWPLFAGVSLWVAWVVFLVVMMVMRLHTTAV